MASRTRRGKPGGPKVVPDSDLFLRMEADYCTGVTRNLRETAQKHGASLATAEQYSSRGGWLEKRKEFLDKVNRTLEAEMQERLVREKRRVVREQLKRAKLMSAKGLEALNAVDPEDMGAMAAVVALKTASEMERKVLRLEDEQARVSVQVAVVPLLASSQEGNLGKFVEALGGKRGEGQPEASGGGGAD